MTRSNKKAGPSIRKQPVWRRSRKSVHRSTAASTSLRKPTLRSTPPPASPDAPPPDERPTPVPSAPRRVSAFEPPPDERPTPVMPEARTNSFLTERPVALPLVSESEALPEAGAKASSRATPEQERGSNSWILAAAALVLVGVAWIAIDNSGSKSSNSDVSPGNADRNAAEVPGAAPAPASEPVPAAAETQDSEDATEDGVIDLDAPEIAQVARAAAATKPAQTPRTEETPRTTAETPKTAAPRVLSAKPAPQSVTQRAQAEAAAFDPSAAQSALATAAQQASSCRQDGDPTGVARVVVTFAPSGRVTSATISGPPFAGTQTGSCIARTMRGMSLPAFTGDHMTISKTVVIM